MRVRTFRLLLIAVAFLSHGTAFGAVVTTAGSVVFETSPYPGSSDTQIFVFDEQQDIAFTDAQSLDFGNIADGTLVNSHYVQFDPTSPSGSVGAGSITFDGPVLGVIVSTDFLNQGLGAFGDSDSYFGLATSLGAYPTGLDPSARGLGSPDDDLLITLGSNTLVINSLDIPGGTAAGNLDGFRVLTAATPVPVPTAFVLLTSALVGAGLLRRRTGHQVIANKR